MSRSGSRFSSTEASFFIVHGYWPKDWARAPTVRQAIAEYFVYWALCLILRREVAGNIQNQVGQSIGIGINLASVASRHNRQVRGDRSIESIQRPLHAVAFSTGKLRSTAPINDGGPKPCG